jgi:Na+/H+ antiporter
MDALIVVLFLLVAVAILVEVANRAGIPYPVLLVLGGLVLAGVPGLPRIQIEPELILVVFLPPLLFGAAWATPLRDLKANVGPIARLSIGLVLFTIVVVAAVAHSLVPGLEWAPAFALGAIVSPTDALAATTVFRRVGAPERIVTILEGESLLNDATALVAYRSAVTVAVGGSFVLAAAVAGFLIAGVGGIVIGVVVGRAFAEVLRQLENPPVEVAISLVVPYVAYLPADQLGLSGVLAAVVAGFVTGRYSATVQTPESRVFAQGAWGIVVFVLNGFAFILIGMELPAILADLSSRSPGQLLGLAAAVSGAVVAARFVWIYVVSFLPGSLRREIARTDPSLAWRSLIVVSWAGLRGVVSLAAALALPDSFPERDLILFLTFAVILVTLVGQGLSLPYVLRRTGLAALDADRAEETMARGRANTAGLAEVGRLRPLWPTHQPLLDRLEEALRDRDRHLATEDPAETEERRLERLEHEEIQRYVIGAQRAAVIELRDRGQINDEVLRTIERELDLEELRMEG